MYKSIFETNKPVEKKKTTGYQSIFEKPLMATKAFDIVPEIETRATKVELPKMAAKLPTIEKKPLMASKFDMASLMQERAYQKYPELKPAKPEPFIKTFGKEFIDVSKKQWEKGTQSILKKYAPPLAEGGRLDISKGFISSAQAKTPLMASKFDIEALRKKPEEMKFEVGAGLTPEQKIRAEQVIRKERPGMGVEIKLPFIQKGITIPYNLLAEQIKGITQWPEKTIKSIWYSFTQPYKVPERKEQIYQVATYQEDLQKAIDEGVPPLIAFGLIGSQAMLDTAIGGQLINNGAKAILKNIAPKLEEVEAARTAMGLSRNFTDIQRQKAYLDIAKKIHPDVPGGSTVLMSKLTKSNKILKTIPKYTTLEKGIRKGAEVLTKPIGAYPVAEPYIATRGLLPSRTGQVPTQPFVGRKPISAGLSIKDIKEKPIKDIKPSDTKEIIKKIQPEDLNTMSDFTEYVIGDYELDKADALDLESEAADIAEKYDLKTFKTTKGLANEFGRILEQQGFKPPAPISPVEGFKTREIGEGYQSIFKPRVGLGIEEVSKPLAQEARKYKSAEEFVDGKEVYYRGTTAPQAGEIKPADTYGLAYGKGVYLASDARFAKDYGPNVSKYYVDWKNPFVMDKPIPNKIIDKLNKDFSAEKMVGGKLEYGTKGEDVLGQLPLNENEINDYLQKLGFDGLKDASSGYNKQSIIFDTSILKTKSQLTDIWKESQAKPTILKRVRDSIAKAGLSVEDVSPKISPEKVSPKPLEYKQAKDIKDKILKEAMTGEIGMEQASKIEFAIEKRQDLNKTIVEGIRNNPFYKKEGTINDEMGDGFLLEKNGRFVVAESVLADKYVKLGYKKGIEIDSLANEAGYDHGSDYLSEMLEIANLPKGTDLRNAVENELLKQPEYIKAKEILESVKGETVKKSTYLLQKANDKIKNILRGKREGKIMTKEEVKTNQEEIIKLLNESNLEAIDKAKFIPKMKNVQTQEQLEKALPEIQERIISLEQKAEKRTAISNLKKELKAIDLKKTRPEYKTQIEGLIADLDIANTSEKKLNRLSNTKKFLEENPDNILPDNVLKQLDILDKKQLRNLTAEDIDLIRISVSHLAKLNELKNDLIFGKTKKNFFELRNKAVEAIKTKPLKSILIKEDVISSDDVIKKVNTVTKLFGVDSMGQVDIAEKLDRVSDPYGLKDIVEEVKNKKPNFRNVVREITYEGFNKGANKTLQFKQEVEDFINSRMKEKGIIVDKKGESWSKFTTTNQKDVQKIPIKLDSGKILELTKGERISIYLNSLRESSLKILLRDGFSMSDNLIKIDKMTQEDVDMIIEGMTKEEKSVAEIGYEFFNDIAKKAVNDVSVKLNGFNIAEEENYYPRKRNSLDLKRDRLKLKTNLTPETMGNFYQQTLEGMSIFKEATTAKGAIIIDDFFKVLTEHRIKIGAYVGIAEPLRNAKALIYDKTFIVETTKRFGEHYIGSMKKFIANIEDSSHSTDNLEKLISEVVLNNIDKSIFKINPWVWAKQPVSYLLANTQMDISYLAKATISSVKQAKIEMAKYSPQLRDRIDGNISREMGEVMNTGEALRLFTGKEASSLKGIRTADMMAVGRLWNAVKMEVSNLYPELTGQEYWDVVARRTEQIVNKTQPTFLQKDRSAIGRSRNLLIRILTKYTTVRNRMYRLAISEVHRYEMSPKNITSKIKLFKNLSLVTIVSSLLIAGIDETRRRVFGKKPSTILEFIFKAVSSSLSLVYFVGDTFNSLISKIQRGTYAGWDTSNVVSGFLDNSIDTIANGTNAIKQVISKENYKSGKHKGEQKWKQSALKMIDGTLDSISKIQGIPYKNVMDLVKRGFNLAKDEDNGKATGVIKSTQLNKLRKLQQINRPRLKQLESLRTKLKR